MRYNINNHISKKGIAPHVQTRTQSHADIKTLRQRIERTLRPRRRRCRRRESELPDNKPETPTFSSKPTQFILQHTIHVHRSPVSGTAEGRPLTDLPISPPTAAREKTKETDQGAGQDHLLIRFRNIDEPGANPKIFPPLSRQGDGNIFFLQSAETQPNSHKPHSHRLGALTGAWMNQTKT